MVQSATRDVERDGVSTGERLFQALKAAIVRTELRPGEALSEAEIARRFAVSRQPVREAFIRLAEAGLVAIRPYRGTFVRKITPADVLEGRFLREAIEVAIVRELALAAPRPDLAPLRASLEAQRRVRPGDQDRFTALDEAFHATFAELAGHRGAWRVVERAKAQMDRVRYLSLDHATPTARLVAQHAAVVQALEAGDADAAEAAMRAHLTELSGALPTLHRAHPELFDPSTPLAVPVSGQNTEPRTTEAAVGVVASVAAGVEHP